MPGKTKERKAALVAKRAAAGDFHRTKLRSSLAPGTVCIVLAGKFRGRRVVMLRQMKKSGVLLITGPYKLNGVPLRRVDPAYVIATSTKIDVSGINVPEKLNDDFFKKPQPENSQRAKTADAFFAEKKVEKTPLSQERKDLQKQVDDQILRTIGTDATMKKYLGTYFSLSSSDKPHKMAF